MRRIRPHLGLTLHILTGATAGTGSVLTWQHILAPHRAPQWVLFLIAGATALLVLRVAAEAQRYYGRRRQPRRRHARPHTRKAL